MNVLIRWLFAGLFVLSTQIADANEIHGVFRVVKGDVKVQSANGQVSRARLGAKVYPKDTIITARDSRAKVVMIDNNEINISPDSRIVIQNYEFQPQQGRKDVLLNIIYGKVRSKVNQKYDGKDDHFQVKTPSAVAGVRGTDFITSYNPANRVSEVLTFSGKVEFGLPGPNREILQSVMVPAGQSARHMPGQAPQPPTNIPKNEVQQMDQDTQVSDNTPSGSTPPTGNEPKDPQQPSQGERSPASVTNNPTNPANPNPAPPPALTPPPETPSTNMFRPEDFAGHPNFPQPPVGPGLASPLPPFPPSHLPVCDTCNRLIEDNGRKLIIRVTPQ